MPFTNYCGLCDYDWQSMRHSKNYTECPYCGATSDYLDTEEY